MVKPPQTQSFVEIIRRSPSSFISRQANNCTIDLAMGLTIGLATSLTVGLTLFAGSSLAELTPDGSLGSERSTVTQAGSNNFEIRGGARRGRNLFHSFQKFDVPDRGEVYFNNPTSIQNIFTRVTGNQPSTILGTLGVQGDANLFLLNPNGVLFGENARLDVRGAFLTTTANAIQFGDQGFFDASSANSVPLLTIDPSALLYNQRSDASIVNRSTVGLTVRNGQSLLLVGGDIVFDQGRLVSFNGHTELGGLIAPGAIQLAREGSRWSLKLPEQVQRSDVKLINQSDIGGLGGVASDLVITAQNIEVLEGIIFTGNMRLSAVDQIRLAGRRPGGIPTLIFSNVASLVGSPTSASATNVQISARSIVLDDGAKIQVGINSSEREVGVEIRSQSLLMADDAALQLSIGSQATNGNLSILTNQLRLQTGASISASTASSGEAGNITIQADTVELIGSSANVNAPTRIESETEDVGLSSSLGNSGDITINARTVAIRDGASISTQTSSQGIGGTVQITADTIELAGVSASRLRSGIFSGPRGLGIGTGNGGDIVLSARQLYVRDGAIVSASTVVGGAGGNINVTAEIINLLGSSPDGRRLSAIASESIGTRSTGDAGDVSILTDSLVIRGGAVISTQTQGSGQAGAITIQANRIEISGTSPASSEEGISRSRISSSVVTPEATGDAGAITLTTRQLNLDQGGILAFTSGQGNAGDIVVQGADSIQLQEQATISTAVEASASGDAGNISLRSRSLQLDNGSEITSSTFGQGSTGIISIQASDRVTFDNDSQISSEVQTGAMGNSQQIVLQTPTFNLRGNSRISAATDGTGRAGDIWIQDATRVLLSDSTISTEVGANATVPATEGDQQGNISIEARSISLNNNAEITASTSGQGRAGDIAIAANTVDILNGGRLATTTRSNRPAGTIRVRALENIRLDGAESGIFASTEAASTGSGGSLELSTTNLDLNNRARISAQSQGSGAAGRVTIQARGDINLSGRARISTESQGENASAGNIRIEADDTFTATDSDVTTSAANASGGDIRLTTRDVRLFGDSDIRTNSARDGGNISVNADTVVALDDSDIFASAAQGRGGNITLNTPAFFGSNYQPEASENAEVSELDNNNRVDLNATGTVSSGTISTPDTSFIQNSLSDLTENVVNTDSLIANSCIARSETGGTFLITGSGGLPERPGQAQIPAYPTGEVRAIPAEAPSDRNWQHGDPIVEPQGVYRLPDGRLVLSRDCQ